MSFTFLKVSSTSKVHNTRCCKQDPPKNAKKNGQSFPKKTDKSVVSNYLSKIIWGETKQNPIVLLLVKKQEPP